MLLYELDDDDDAYLIKPDVVGNVQTNYEESYMHALPYLCTS